MDRSDASALADLQMHWDEAYVIALDGDIWSARYLSSTDELRAHTSTELRELIRSDYAYRQKADLIAYDPGGDDDEDVDSEDAEGGQPADGDGETGPDSGPVHPGPVQDGPVQDGPVQDCPVQDGPVQDGPVQDDDGRGRQGMAADSFAAIRGERMSM